MKKLIVCLMLICTLLLCSCSGELRDCDANIKYVHSKYFDTEVLEDGDGYYIIRDTITGYKYLVLGGYHGAAMTRID